MTGSPLARPIRRLVVVTAGENPSFDYYFAPRLALHAGPPIRRMDLTASRRAQETESWDDTFFIFCRYVSRTWLETLEARARAIAGIGLFVDDDMAALARGSAAPWWYRRKLNRFALRRWASLTPMLSALWVSTPPLVSLWAPVPARLLPPLASDGDLSSSPVPSPSPLVGLHATASHAADQRWLEPVVRGVLAADRSITFEVIADHGAARRWRGDPRVRVMGSQSWPAYRADTAARGRDLLLAPLLPTRPNAARADVKRIDAARCGAALLVSDPDVYRVSPREAALGMTAPLDTRAWIDAILSLVRAPDRRRALVALNRETLAQTRGGAGALFAPAEDGYGDAWRLS